MADLRLIVFGDIVSSTIPQSEHTFSYIKLRIHEESNFRMKNLIKS